MNTILLDIKYIISYVYKYNQLPISRTRKRPGKLSDLARYPTYKYIYGYIRDS